VEQETGGETGDGVMDYVQHELLTKIKRIKQREDASNSTLASLYRFLLEYQLYLVFACLWNKNEERLSREKKNEIIMGLKKPMVSNLLGAVLMLAGVDQTFFGGSEKAYKRCMDAFIGIRNKYFGHGMLVPGLQEGKYKALYEELDRIYTEVTGLNIPVLALDCKFYYRQKPSGTQVVVFDDADYNYRSLDEALLKDSGLADNELCYFTGTEMYRLSPFVMVQPIEDEVDTYEFFCYSGYSIKNNIFEYCKISKFDGTPFCQKLYPGYFQSFQEENKYTICKANGIICNKFENNYDYFISIHPITGYVTQIWEFIYKNRSNTCLTIRGGGGIGKTALVQYICTKFLFEPFQNKTDINYVVFCSAKDRELKQSLDMMGRIRYIQEDGVIHTYEDLLNIVSHVLDLDIQADSEAHIAAIEEALIHKSGVLLIIDDFETLSNVEKGKIVALIPRLKVHSHKVLITTRSQYMVGEEYYIQALAQDQIIHFMRACFERIAETLKNQRVAEDFNAFVSDRSNRKRIFDLTQGLPLLALQLGKLLQLTGFEPLSMPEKWGDDVEDFLLGRLYSYFSTRTSKLLFIVISQYYKCGKEEINIHDLSCFYRLYCAYFGDEKVDFDMDLRELEKLKIIFLEADHIKICNHISNAVLEKCKESIFEEYQNSKSVFDDRVIKLVCTEGIEKGIPDYIRMDSAKPEFEFVHVFALENVLSYTNEIRFQIIENYVHKKMASEDHAFLHDLFIKSQSYFIMEDRFNEFYGNLCLEYSYIIPELEDWIQSHKQNNSADLLLAKLNEELDDILDSIDVYLDYKRKKSAPQGYMIELSQDIRRRIGAICNYTIRELNRQSLEGYEEKVGDIRLMIDEISSTKEFNMLDNEMCKKFMNQT